VLLLTGATGTVGSAVLRRLTARRIPVRCLVRDPRRLGPDRVRVQIALGDLADPPSFRNALRGVTTVVHLAASRRDQPRGSIEELNAIATWRMVQAAERAGVRRLVFAGALGAVSHDRTRFLRSKALAEQAVAASPLRTTILAPSLVVAADEPLVALLSRVALAAPVVPLSGRGRAVFQPIWADDVADCVVAALDRDEGDARYELAGPELLTHEAVVRGVLAAAGRPRPLVKVPVPVVFRTLRAAEALAKSRTPLTWDEAELLEVSRTTPHGTRDAEALGVRPRRLADAL
jgi:NADH dehydrogenase